MNEYECDTASKIIQAAIKLISDNGFKNVTMKDIATAAGTSEMTVYRHFSNKKGVLKAVWESCSYLPSLQAVFTNKLAWELEKDLLLISNTYQHTMEKNKTAILMLMREKTFLTIADWEKMPPCHFQKFMVDYLNEMKEKGKIDVENIEGVALSFLAVNFGYFYSNATLEKKIATISQDEYIKTAVKLFVKGLKKAE